MATVSKSSKVKKSTSSSKPRSYPPYVEMVKEAIVTLKEKTGSSQYAITKFIEEKQGNQLPANFKKLLLVQLKKFVASGKLVKVKNSFKLAAESKSAAVKKPSSKAPVASKVVAKPKSGASAKPKAEKAVKTVKGKKAAPKPKTAAAAATKSKKSAKTATITSPGKKAAAVVKAKKAAAVVKAKKAAVTKKAATVKPKKVSTSAVKKPKSLKSPIKKTKK